MRKLTLLMLLCSLGCDAGIITFFRVRSTQHRMEARGLVWERRPSLIPHGWTVDALKKGVVVHDGYGTFRLPDNSDVYHVPEAEIPKVEEWLKAKRVSK